MGRNLQFRRGLESQVSSADLLINEPGYSTDEKKLRIGATVFLDELKTNLKIDAFKNTYIEELNLTTLGLENFENKIKLNNKPTHINLIKDDSKISGIEIDKMYDLSTKQEHIIMANGFDANQSYLELLNTMRSSFVLSGETITVNNGIENSPLLGATINGKTTNCLYIDDNWIKKTEQNSPMSTIVMGDCSQLKVSANYILYVEVEENTRNEDYKISSQSDEVAINSTCYIEAGKTGVFKFAVTTKSNFDGCVETLRSTSVSDIGTGTISFRRALIEFADESSVYNTFPKIGVASVQANIVHNGVKHVFYASYQDKLNNKAIELNGTQNLYDTLIINKDNSGLLIQNTFKLILSGSDDEKWTIESVNSNGLTNFYLNGLPFNSINNSDHICDQYMNEDTLIADAKQESLSMNRTGLSIRKFVSSGIDTILSFKAKLKADPVTVIYQLETPITTIIPKELMPIILIQKENSFYIDSLVDPYDSEFHIAINHYQEQLEEITVLASNLETLNELVTNQ